MKEFLKKNFAIVLAFALPVLLIAGITLSAYLPSLFLSTDYNFIYATCTDGRYYNCGAYLQKRYSVVNGRLVENPVDPDQYLDDGIRDVNEQITPRIFLHDTEKNESREISREEAQLLSLSNLLTSPDGVTVSSSYNRSPDIFFIFNTRSSYGYYLTKGRARSRLDLIHSDSRYYYPENFHFIGWVLPARS